MLEEVQSEKQSEGAHKNSHEETYVRMFDLSPRIYEGQQKKGTSTKLQRKLLRVLFVQEVLPFIRGQLEGSHAYSFRREAIPMWVVSQHVYIEREFEATHEKHSSEKSLNDAIDWDLSMNGQ